MTKVLIVDDEPAIQRAISFALTQEGFLVETAETGPDGLARIRSSPPGLVILDLRLPGLDGLDLCQLVKSDPGTKHIPIVMVSARTGEKDIIKGLDLGADDYVTKPFSPRQLMARVRAVMRRASAAESEGGSKRIERSGLVLDLVLQRASVEGRPVAFTATEFRLMSVLASHAGKVFTRDQLVSEVISDEMSVDSRNIDVHVKSIRQKLGPQRTLVETVRRVGYRFREGAEPAATA